MSKPSEVRNRDVLAPLDGGHSEREEHRLLLEDPGRRSRHVLHVPRKIKKPTIRAIARSVEVRTIRDTGLDTSGAPVTTTWV